MRFIDLFAGLGGFQQRIALFEHALVVADHTREARGALDEQLIGESAACRGVAAHDLEVFGSEEHDLRVARELRRLDRSPVHPDLVGTLAVHLRLEQHVTLTVGEPYFRPAGIEHDVINANPGAFAFIEIELKRSR